MVSITKKYLIKKLAEEHKAIKDYGKHSNTKEGKFLKEIQHDEMDHAKKIARHIKKMK